VTVLFVAGNRAVGREAGERGDMLHHPRLVPLINLFGCLGQANAVGDARESTREVKREGCGALTLVAAVRKVDVRLPGMMSLSRVQAIELSDATLVNVGTCFTIPVSRHETCSSQAMHRQEICSGSEAGSYLRLIDSCKFYIDIVDNND